MICIVYQEITVTKFANLKNLNARNNITKWIQTTKYKNCENVRASEEAKPGCDPLVLQVHCPWQAYYHGRVH